MEQIKNWLNCKGTYDAGVKLYEQHGTNPLFKKLFQEGYSPFKQLKLFQELKKLTEETAPLPTYQVLPQMITTPATDPEGKVQLISHEPGQKELHIAPDLTPYVSGWPQKMDPYVQGLYDQWLPLFSQKKHLQACVFEHAKEAYISGNKQKREEAGAMVHKILELRDQCRALYEKRDFYLKTGQVQQEEALVALPEDPRHYATRLESFKRYVRQYSKQLTDDPNHKNAGNWANLIEQYKWGIEKLKDLMGL